MYLLFIRQSLKQSNKVDEKEKTIDGFGMKTKTTTIFSYHSWNQYKRMRLIEGLTTIIRVPIKDRNGHIPLVKKNNCLSS